MTSVLIGTLIGSLGLALILGYALGRDASVNDKRCRRAGPVDYLGALTSPTGKPFFPTLDAIEDLADVVRSARSADEPSGTS